MTINKTLLTVCRSVHIYLTMLGLLVMLLFGVTGFTINHEGGMTASTPVVSEVEGKVPMALITAHDELRIVEHLRQAFSIKGAMTDFTEIPDEFAIAFKEPGQVWDITVAKGNGQVTARREEYDFVAIINNLHRGRYTGPAWSLVIDFSAILIVLACLTGFVLWLALPKRRQLGIAFLALGTVATMAVIYALVPGPDAMPRKAGETRSEQRGR
ncbi:MAG: PepSY-associated TM helix domain-containing protein [Opitutaceae bacterium]